MYMLRFVYPSSGKSYLGGIPYKTRLEALKVLKKVRISRSQLFPIDVKVSIEREKA